MTTTASQIKKVYDYMWSLENHPVLIPSGKGVIDKGDHQIRWESTHKEAYFETWQGGEIIATNRVTYLGIRSM